MSVNHLLVLLVLGAVGASVGLWVQVGPFWNHHPPHPPVVRRGAGAPALAYGAFGGREQLAQVGDGYQARGGSIRIDGGAYGLGKAPLGVPSTFDAEGGVIPKGDGKGKFGNKSCTLAVAAVIRGENHGLVEWIEHYVGEGACHFYFLNNDEPQSPSREGFLRLIHPYERVGMVTHFHHPPGARVLEGRRFAWMVQMGAFNPTVHAAAKRDGIAEWLAVVDLDEYMYANSWNTTLAMYLENDVPDTIDQICMPERAFGTSGFKWQPSCIVPFFTQRARFTGARTVGGKCVVRVDAASYLSVHMHQTVGQPNQTERLPIVEGVMRRTFVSIRGSRATPMAGWGTVENDVPEWPIAFNHYRPQSFEHFFRKRTGQHSRTQGGVRRLDADCVTDDFLLRKMHWRRPALGRCAPDLGPPEYAKTPLNATAFEAWYGQQVHGSAA